MKSKIKSAGGCRRVLHIEAPAEEVRGDYEAVVKEYVANASVPGFRKGKTPRAVIEKSHKEGIQESFMRRVFPRVYQEAIKEEKVTPAAMIGMDNLALSADTGFTADVTIDVYPEIKLPKYAKISIKPGEIKVTDADVDSALENLRRRMTQFTPAPDGYQAADGDGAMVDFKATIGGKPVEGDDSQQILSGEGRWIPVSKEPQRIPGFGEALIGKKAGESGGFTASFLDTESVESVKGKQVHYDFTVKTIRQRVLPDVNDEFCKRFGCDSVEDIRKLLKEDLERSKKEEDNSRRRNELAEILTKDASFDLPQSMVDGEKRAEVTRILQQTMRQGIDTKYIEEQKEEIMKAADEIAPKRVKLTLILLRIADEEKIEATVHEIDDRINSIAAYRGEKNPAAVRAELERDGSINDLVTEIRCNKVMEWLLDRPEEAKK